MGSLQERIAALTAASANLLTQLNELDELRERVRKAQLLAHTVVESHWSEGPPRLAGPEVRQLA